MPTIIKYLACSAVLFLVPGSLMADPIFSTNTFDSGSDGWQPWSTSDIGGISPGNPYLKIAADGSGVFGKMITFNSNPEWTGNYGLAGVTGIRLDIANMSDSDNVHLRVAVGNRASPQQSGGTWWISNIAVLISSESAWTSVFLPIVESDMLVVGNIVGESDNESFAETLSDIQNIRILSSTVPIGPIGDEFVGDVGVDNVALVPEPSTLPMIGIGVITLALYKRRCVLEKKRKS